MIFFILIRRTIRARSESNNSNYTHRYLQLWNWLCWLYQYYNNTRAADHLFAGSSLYNHAITAFVRIMKHFYSNFMNRHQTKDGNKEVKGTLLLIKVIQGGSNTNSLEVLSDLRLNIHKIKLKVYHFYE